MAVLTGISGMSMGDGTTNGKIALDIQKGILKILSESGFSYITATVGDKRQVAAGSVSYQLPEILQTEAYGDGTTGFQNINSGIIEIPINIRRTVKYSYEIFDYARLGFFTGVVGMIANSVAVSIQNDLNANFWSFLISQFNLTNGTLRAQNLTLPDLGVGADINNPVEPTSEAVRTALFKLQIKAIQINKTYNKRALGIPKEELMIFLAPECDAVIRQAYYNQPNQLAERVVAKDLVGRQLGAGLWYYLDKMLNNSIPAGTSFSKDQALDTTGFLGFIIHNEAVAMPFNFNSIIMVTDPQNGNPRFIAKYQFGIGLLRDNLIYSITTTAPKA